MTVDVAQVHLHDSLGERLGTLVTASSVNRAWTIMQPSQGEVTVSLDDPLLSELWPELGRAVVIESDAYPHPWVGVLSSVTDDHLNGQVRLELQSLDTLLRDRFLPETAQFSNSAGEVFRQVLELCDSANGTGVRVSNNRAIGPRYDGVFPERTVYGALNAICAHTGHEWWLDYDVTGHRIVAVANFQQHRGFDRIAILGIKLRRPRRNEDVAGACAFHDEYRCLDYDAARRIQGHAYRRLHHGPIRSTVA